MATASEEALRAIFEQIRDERKTHANTATRIGDAFLSLLSHLDNGTFLKQGDTESREYILSVTGGASASLTKLFTLETVTEQGEERVTLATPLAPFKELELRDYLQIGDARLRWDSERQALYVTGKDGSTPVGFYSTGWISALGANDGEGEGGGGGGLAYSRLDTWEGYSDEEQAGWVLSAYLGVRLYQDIENLKNGVAMSYAVTGTGNAITDVTRDGSRWVFTKGKTFSELWHTHTLSDIYNLHSSWDAILKVAPSAYVTRWPTAAEVGALTQSAADSRYALKTVTISAGAGLTGGGNLSANRTMSLAAVGTAGTYTKVTVDAYGRVTAHASLSAADIPTLSISKISGLQAALDKKLEATAFTELFEKVTLADGTTAIRAKYGLYSDEFLSAKGANDSQGGGGGGGLSYSRLDSWEGYTDEEKGGWVLSAYLGVRLYRDIENLKNGVAMSYAVQGTGNAITDVTRDGSRWVFTKGKTFSELGHTHPLSNISDLNSSWDSLLKEAPSAYITRWPSWTEVKDKPSTFTPSAHQHPLSDLSDLHSSWDAILKAAPFAGVSRWPSWGEVTGKPTSFTPSSHTHAISQVSGLQAALDAKLPAATFNELFEKVTLESGETAIRAKLGLYSDKWVSAKGANPNQGEGGGFAYTRLDTWEGYDSDTMDGWVLSAKLGYSLYNDVKSLKAGAAVSFTIQGTGNAITDVSKSGTRLVFTKGVTFALSSHQHLLSNISDLNSGWDSLLKTAPSAYVTRWPSWSEVSGKPTTFTPASHTHTISQVSDLHASWDALLKAAPSGYVTRWPSIGEVTGKQSLAIKLNGGGTEGTNLFTYNGTAAKTVNITAASIGAPTKTGSGASGTWGISISGTAALATRLTPTEYGSGDLDALTHGSYATRFFYAAGGNTTANTPNGSDGFGLFVMRTAAGYTGQILMSPYGVLYTRYNGNNAWSAWRTVLDTDNYAATLDGRYLRTVSIATITDLHSSWDALLKAQKPTTLGGYGITDGVTTPAYTGSGNVLTAASISGHTITFTKGITAALASRKVTAGNGLTGGGTLTADITLNVASANAGISVNADNIQLNTINALTSTDTVKPLSAAQGKKIWDFVTDLFEKVNIGTSSAPVYAIRAKYGLFSDEFLSAKGANDSEGEGGGVAYNRLDTWDGYSDALAGWVLSAGLGYSLYTDVKSLKQGAAVSLVTTGSGNAVTDIAKSGTKLTVTKGLAFLTAHQNIFPLTIQGNGTSLAKYTPNSAALTVNITPASIGAAAASHSHSQYLTAVSLATISDLHSSWDAVLKAQKPNWLTSVSLATISDLHSSWDAILKAAPSAYVTRWPNFSEVGSKPTTLAGYGITDAPTKTGSGASGTWGISISGSAALAGFLNKNTAFNYSGQAGLQYYDADMQSTANGNAWSGPSKGWHQILHMPLSVANFFTEIALPVNDVNGLAWRQRRSSSYYGWYRLLDSNNYTSYTVTKTGGGASGTWGIGISGNAATASKWAAKRTISLTGAVTGSVSLDGSGNVSLATTYATGNISALDSRYVNVSGDTMTGTLTLASGAVHTGARVGNVYMTAIDRALIFQNAKEIRFGQSDKWEYNEWGGLTYDHTKKYLYLGIADGTIFQENAGALSGGSLLTPGISNIFVGNNTSNKVWHAGNDGSGSGLDADLLDGVQLSSLMRCDGANAISLTGGNGNTEGYRLVMQKTMDAWSINDIVFVASSRHNGQGIMSIAFHTNEDISSYTYQIRFFGATLNNITQPWRAFYNASTGVFRLYWHYVDYTAGGINVLRREGFPAPSNGTWYETLPSDNGTELGISYNSADTLGGTAKSGLLTALSSSSGTNLSITVGGTTKTVADLYASKAAQLTTARTLWGQSFNGTGNVSGNMTGVGSISASGNFSTSKATNTHLAGNQGQALVNSTASAGAYVMLHRGCSTNGYFTLGTWGQRYCLFYTARSVVTAGSNNYTKMLTLLDEGGNSSFPGSLYANTGLYSDGYVSAKGQNTSSDMRLKRVLRDVSLSLEDIANAPSFLFSWKKNGLRDVGSSAQYWKNVLPEAVKERGGWLEMAYGNLALLSAISIARETLRLDRRLALLEEENRRLRQRVARLEEGRKTGSVA